MDIIGFKIKQLRQAKSLTQSQLADRLGLSKGMISAYENCSRSPSYEVLIQMTKIFNVSTDYMLGISKERIINASGLTDGDFTLISSLVDSLKKKI